MPAFCRFSRASWRASETSKELQKSLKQAKKASLLEVSRNLEVSIASCTMFATTSQHQKQPERRRATQTMSPKVVPSRKKNQKSAVLGYLKHPKVKGIHLGRLKTMGRAMWLAHCAVVTT